MMLLQILLIVWLTVLCNVVDCEVDGVEMRIVNDIVILDVFWHDDDYNHPFDDFDYSFSDLSMPALLSIIMSMMMLSMLM